MTTMNKVQQANAMLGVLVGEVGRAIWLAVRVDELPIHAVAQEHGVSVSRAKEILSTCDYALAQTGIGKDTVPLPQYKTAWGGFHQTDDAS